MAGHVCVYRELVNHLLYAIFAFCINAIWEGCVRMHTHKRTHWQLACVLHEQVSQAPTSKSNTRAPPTATASSVPLPLVVQHTKHQQEAVRVQRLISTHSIKFQSNLSHWTLASDWGKANRDRANKAAAVRPCLAAWNNVSCDESWKLSLLCPPKY